MGQLCGTGSTVLWLPFEASTAPEQQGALFARGFEPKLEGLGDSV